MRLRKLTIRNFGSFAGKQTIWLERVGLLCIEGENRDDKSATSNGTGKSTVIDALYWCLFGITMHEPSCEGDEVVNDKIGKDCMVSVLFENNGVPYRVDRGRQVMDRDVFGAKHGVKLWRKKRDVSKGTNRDTQAEIVRVLGMSASTFRHAVIFGQSKAFRFSRLSDADKKSVMDEMIGAGLYASAGELAAKRLAVANEKLSDAEEQEASTARRLDDENRRLDELRSAVQKARRNASLAHSKEHERIQQLTKELSEARQDAKQLKDAPSVLDAAIEAHKRAKRVLEEARANRETASRMVTAAKERLGELEQSLSDMRHLSGSKCPTCKQKVRDSHAKKCTRSIDEAIEAQMGVLVVLQRDLGAHVERVREVQEQAERAEKTEHKAEQLMRRYRVVQSRVESLDEKLKHAERTEQDESAELRRLIRKSKKRLLVFGEVRQERVKAIARAKQKVAALQFWQEGFSTRGLRSLMMDSVLPFLNAKLVQYTNAITSGNIEVQFKAQRTLKSGKQKEEFHVDVQNKYGAKQYKQLSAGERAKVDLVVGLALQDMAAAHSRTPVNVAFFDEAFEGLDAAGCDRVMALLSNIAKHRESIFVITHNEAFKAYVTRCIRVVKENGLSRIEN